MGLINALADLLPRGATQAVVSLERDEDTPWPTLAERHADRIELLQPVGPVLLGGHSLGGLLAAETAVVLEQRGRTVGALFLFDSSHPQQFKPEWTEPAKPPPGETEAGKRVRTRSRALRWLEITLRSMGVDLNELGWPTMSQACVRGGWVVTSRGSDGGLASRREVSRAWAARRTSSWRCLTTLRIKDLVREQRERDDAALSSRLTLFAPPGRSFDVDALVERLGSDAPLASLCA